jgi:hypothetical protein
LFLPLALSGGVHAPRRARRSSNARRPQRPASIVKANLYLSYTCFIKLLRHSVSVSSNVATQAERMGSPTLQKLQQTILPTQSQQQCLLTRKRMHFFYIESISQEGGSERDSARERQTA